MLPQPRCVRLCHWLICLCSGQDSTACGSARASYAFHTTYKSLSVTQVKLDLADELQSAFPPGLRPFVQRVYVRATSCEQLKGLGDKLSEVPPGAALELELSFGEERDLNLGTVRTFVRRASACAP